MALNNQQWLICHKTKPNQTNLCRKDKNLKLMDVYSPS